MNVTDLNAVVIKIYKCKQKGINYTNRIKHLQCVTKKNPVN